MKRLLAMMILMLAVEGQGAFPVHVNTGQSDMNAIVGNWDSFSWVWLHGETESNILTVTTGTTGYDLTNTAGIGVQMTSMNATQGYTSVYYTTNVVMQGATLSNLMWTVSSTPAAGTYRTEVYAWNGVTSNEFRTLAQGKIRVVDSLIGLSTADLSNLSTTYNINGALYTFNPPSGVFGAWPFVARTDTNGLLWVTNPVAALITSGNTQDWASAYALAVTALPKTWTNAPALGGTLEGCGNSANGLGGVFGSSYHLYLMGQGPALNIYSLLDIYTNTFDFYQDGTLKGSFSNGLWYAQGAAVSTQGHSQAFSSLTATPTSLIGYGITNTVADSSCTNNLLATASACFYDSFLLIPTNANYNIAWIGPFDEVRTLAWAQGKTDGSTATVSIVEQVTNQFWFAYTTNVTWVCTTNSARTNAFSDATIAVGNMVGVKIESYDTTGCSNITVTVRSNR